MCTALTYTDSNGIPYGGRTLELDVGEPYFVVAVPSGQQFTSQVSGHPPVEYTAAHAFLGIAAPGALPEPGHPLTAGLLKASEGINTAGLSFSLNAYPTKPDDDEVDDASQALLEASDLGAWALACFTTVDEVKAGLASQPINLTRLPLVGNVAFPFHALIRDATGASIVLQWNGAGLEVSDNPVGVLTNGPEFGWHLTNLSNWTHLDNIDRSSAVFGSLTANQPDSGIATTALPSSNTAIGRFVRAVYYTTFAEKFSDPDQSVLALSKIMNNFDRPRGATVDLPSADGAGVKFQGSGHDEGSPSTEFTAITILSDLLRGRFFVRSYDAFNFSLFELDELAAADGVRLMPVAELDPLGGNATKTLQDSRG